MKLGVIIDRGPQDWQILQQKDGVADIFLEGEWFLPEDRPGKGRVFARVAREASGDCVLPWAECETTHENHWEILLKRIPAGGLYRIETCLHAGEPNPMEWGIRGDMIHHLGVGDVYVIAGQSNAAGYGKDPAYDPPEIGVHVLKNSGRWDLASHPLNESTGTIHEVNREMANPGASPYLSFARMLKRELGYPIGLLQTSLGGSGLEAWNPEEEGSLYRNMLDVIRSQGGGVTGILWYQGCRDTAAELAGNYLERFAAMVRHLRQDTGIAGLPVLTVQLNRYTRPPEQDGDKYWGTVREALRLAARIIPGVTIVPSIDSVLSDAIHNSAASNILLGERIAKMALAKLYGKRYICMAPDIKIAVESDDGREAVLLFENVNSRLYFFDTEAKYLPFTVEDEAGTVGIKNGNFVKDTVTLELERPLCGKSFVNCASEQNPRAIIPVDYEGHLPMLPFYHVEIVRNSAASGN